MSMNFNSVGSFYQKAVKGSAKTSKAESSELKHGAVSSETKAENSDKILLSHDASQKYEVYRMTKGVMQELDEIDNGSKIAALKESISNNTYQVPIDKLAQKLLSRFVGE